MLLAAEAGGNSAAVARRRAAEKRARLWLCFASSAGRRLVFEFFSDQDELI